jgi:hypothetical protein
MKAFPNKNTIIKYAGKFGPIHEKEEIQNGMDLRDYFAAKAMPSLVKTFENYVTTPNDVAKLSYQYADAMMKAREGK